MVVFFSENYYIYHYSSVCSCTFIFMVVLILFSILFPFFTNIGVLDKFWRPIKISSERPIVQFNDEFLIELTDNTDRMIYFSPTNLRSDNDILTSITFEPTDYNNDGAIDVIKMKGTITTKKDIRDVRFFLFFDYYLTEETYIHIRSKVHLFCSQENDSISKIKTTGELVLKQNKAFFETYFLQEESNKKNLEEEINEVLNNPFDKNDNYYFDFKKNSIYIQKTNIEKFDFDITMNIPYYQEVIVQLPNYTNLKNKWVLYSFLFFPTMYICYMLMGLVIENHIFKTRIKSDIPIKI